MGRFYECETIVKTGKTDYFGRLVQYEDSGQQIIHTTDGYYDEVMALEAIRQWAKDHNYKYEE